jgi:hypothetical protein
MPLLQVYDPPMCCSTGACGPDPDPDLTRMARDLAWFRHHDVDVERYNLAQEPAAFVDNPLVLQKLQAEDSGCLPLVLVDGAIVSSGAYPTRARLLELLGIEKEQS